MKLKKFFRKKVLKVFTVERLKKAVMIFAALMLLATSFLPLLLS